MTAPLWPALALIAAPAQTQTAPPPPPELSDPLADPAAQPQTAPSSRPTTGSGELTDPATRPARAAATPAVTVRRHAPGDPFEKFNRRNYARHETFDRKLFRPIAMGYKHVVPNFLRTALRNIFSNLSEPVVFVNYVLQLKPGKAIETLTRFAMNSSLGIGGAVDVAKTPPIHLPHRPNGMGDTLGYYGVKPGPYLFLPFVGPTTLRDLLGGQADGALLPAVVGKPFDTIEYQIGHPLLTGIDERAEADQELKALNDGAVDPYATLRSVFLQARAGEIANLHHRRLAVPATPELGEPLADPAGTTLKPAPGRVPDELSDPLTDPAATPTSAAPAPAPAQPASAPAPAQPAPAPAPAAPARR